MDLLNQGNTNQSNMGLANCPCKMQTKLNWKRNGRLIENTMQFSISKTSRRTMNNNQECNFIEMAVESIRFEVSSQRIHSISMQKSKWFRQPHHFCLLDCVADWLACDGARPDNNKYISADGRQRLSKFEINRKHHEYESKRDVGL